MTESVEAARAAIAAVVQPLREQLADVEAEIEAKVTEIEQLRGVERNLKTMIRAADPTEPRPGPKKAAPYRISEERVEHVLGYLRAFNGDEFSAPILLRSDDYAQAVGISQSPLNKTLQLLADRGLIRLDRIGGGGGRERFYKLTGAGRATA